MKAPEKLYLRKRCKLPYDVVQNEWYEKPPISIYGNIEYVRIDAFIEKAENFIYSALNDGIMETANIEDFLRLFKNYMKGE